MQLLFHLEPMSLYQSDGKHPDDASVVPLKEGRALVWDETCPDILAHSYQQMSVREAGAVVAEAERCKKLKYAQLNSTYLFVPVGIWVGSAQSRMPSSGIWQVGSEESQWSPRPTSTCCIICLSLSGMEMPLSSVAQLSRSLVRSSPAFDLPVRDSRFLGLGHCYIYALIN